MRKNAISPSLLKPSVWFTLSLALALSLMFLTLWSDQTLAAGTPAGKTIDWTHPIRVQPLFGRRSGLGRDPALRVVPQPLPSLVGQIQPHANFPTTCLNNVAYTLGFHGQDTWTVTRGTVKSWVQYLWCPRWQGDSIGINWAYGRAYVLSGCKTILIGEQRLSGLGWYGAAIVGSSSANDGEVNAAYRVCNGSYAWDASLIVRGDGKYSVLMLLRDTEGDQFNAQSPTF